MPQDLPYLPTYKNVASLFEKIASAKTPDAFTYRFLSDTLGLKGTGDRALIPLLKNLGFLDQSGKPTPQYPLLKNKASAGRAIADAVRSAYESLFSANERAHQLSAEELKGLVAQVSGADPAMITKICGTLNALLKLADFSATPDDKPGKKAEIPETVPKREPPGGEGGLRPDFHYNIQVHLPANGTEDTYINIFNAIRKAFR